MVAGLPQLQKRLGELVKQSQQMQVVVFVGYAARHSVYVHEDLTQQHKAGKQGKYLEGPARESGPEIVRLVADRVASGGNPRQALFAGGRLVLSKSRKVVPVLTGALRSSGYVAFEEDEEAVAAEALERADSILEAADE